MPRNKLSLKKCILLIVIIFSLNVLGQTPDLFLTL